VAAVRRRYGLVVRRFVRLWSLTKPEVNFLIAATAAAGFWMGTLLRLHTSPGRLSFTLLLAPTRRQRRRDPQPAD